MAYRMHSDFVAVAKPVSVITETPVDKVRKNQASFRAIFGEEPPTWWGNFSAIEVTLS